MISAFVAHQKNQLRGVRQSSLIMNAFFLMLSTFVLAVSGFVFWALVTRTYDAAAVGLATTMISASGLLSLLGLAGFDTTFVRFLPATEKKNDYINTGMLLVASASAALAMGAALILPLVSHNFEVLREPWALVSFIFFTVISSLYTLCNAIFLAFKRAKYTLAVNILLGSVKVVLPLVAVHGDAVAIFMLAGSAQLVGVLASLVWIQRKFSYRFAAKVDMGALRLVRKFSFSVYASSILNLLPPTLLPLVIVHLMGTHEAAYYYMAFTIASVLYTITYASMQSVFAEGSHDETALHAHVKKAAALIALLLLPAALATALISPFLLSIFGQEYAHHAAPLLQLFAIGAVPVAVYSALGAVFKVTKHLSGVVGMNTVYAAAIIGLSYILVPQWGLMAVGWSWIAGNMAACITGFLFLMATNKKVGDKDGAFTSTRR